MMLPNVSKAKLACWSEYNNQVFEQVKQAVNNCPTLYFTRDDLSCFYIQTPRIMVLGHAFFNLRRQLIENFRLRF